MKRNWKIQLGYALGNGVARNDHGEAIGEEFILEECMIDKGRLRDAPYVKPESREIGVELVQVASSDTYHVRAHMRDGCVLLHFSAYGGGHREFKDETFLGLLRKLSAVHDEEEM